MVMRGEERAAPSLVLSAATPVVEAKRSMNQTNQGEEMRGMVREDRVEMEGKEIVVVAAAARGRAWQVVVVVGGGEGVVKKRAVG